VGEGKRQAVAVLAIQRAAGERKIVILYLGQEGFRMNEADLIRKMSGVAFGDLSRSVGAAIVYENEFPIFVSLPQDAFDALAEVVSSVIAGCYEAH
jgi:hypothetical protein